MSINQTLLKILYCLSIVVICNPVAVWSQDDVFVLHQLGSEDGLTDDRYNYYIHQDEEGLVWISSISGLNRFDGREVKTYLPDRGDSNALHSVYVSHGDFHDNPRGNLWFTEDESIIKYNRQQDNFKRLQIINSKNDTIATGYDWSYLDKQTGLLWFYNKHEDRDYLYTCDTRSEGHPIELVAACQVGLKDQMYRTSEQELLLFAQHPDSILIHTFINNKVGNSACPYYPPDSVKVYDVLPIDEYSAWVASNKGLYKLHLDTEEWIPQASSYQNHRVVDITEIEYRAPNCLLLGTSNKGIFLYNPATEEYQGKIKRLYDGAILDFEPSIDRIYLDQTDNLWISTKNGGIYYTNLNKPKFGLKIFDDAAISMVPYGDDGAIIAGLKAVYRWQPTAIDTIPLPEDDSGIVEPKCLFRDSRQQLWLCTETALYFKDPKADQFELYTKLPEPAKAGQNFTGITELSDGSLLVAHIDAPLIQISYDRKQTYYRDGTNKGIEFVEAIQDHLFTYSDNNFRIETYQGGQPVHTQDFPRLAIVNQIEYDKQRSCFWVATDNGLYKLWQKQDLSWSMTIEHQLQERTVSSLLCDKQGRLWIGSPRGILTYQPDNGAQHMYSPSDLLQDYHFNRSSALHTANGRFIFGGANGINYFVPEQIKSNVAMARPMITNLLINQQEGIAQNDSDNASKNPLQIERLRLPYDQNNLTLYLSAGEYSDPQACRFIYQLQLIGSKVEGQNTIQEHILRFSNLSDGHYQLKIWAINADGIVSDESRDLEINIRPPLHRQRWFQAVIAAFVLLFIYMSYRYHLHNATTQQRLKQNIAETELAVRRLQMTPHFIFNSLNAIGSLVRDGNATSARDFLLRFSDLMRKILQNSEIQINSLGEEIDLLKNYLSLEQLRFKDKLSFSFHVDDELDLDDTELPTMILQPFVENAIIHGIGPKKTPGHIQVNFLRHDHDQLLCEVRDDGVGRNHKPAKKDHKSMATSITQRRLEVLAKSMDLSMEPSFKIDDEFDEQGVASGTTVRVYFPLLF